jgi:hypothetical protein
VTLCESTAFQPLSIALSCSRAHARAAPFVLNVFDILCPLRRIYVHKRSPTGKIEVIFLPETDE